MRTVLSMLLLSVGALASQGRDLAEAKPGSRLPPDKNECTICHGESALWEGEQRRLFVPSQSLAADVHFLKGVNCHDCHGGNPKTDKVNEAHAEEDGFRKPMAEVWKSCAACHKSQQSGLSAGVHGVGSGSDGSERQGPLDCRTCHGPQAHGMLPVRDARSPVYLNHQVQLCGGCHEKDLEAYRQSAHGRGLEESGLLVAAVCADCHGAHGIYPAGNSQSTLHPAKVTAVCAKCHRFIEERLEKSVHGRGDRRDGQAAKPAPGGEMTRKPSCTDCHEGHNPPSPRSVTFRLGVPGHCGDCHADLSTRYGLSVHGALTALGYGPAAQCSDCHGGHDVLPASDPDSTLSAANRLATCAKCHPDATAAFLDFDPHADHHDKARDPVLYWVYVVLMTLLISTFTFFGLHSLLWFIRSLVAVLRYGRPRALAPGGAAYVRFGPFHRAAHIIMVLSFLGLALTGLPLKYSHHQWAYTVANIFGGFESTGVAHRVFGVINIGCLVVYAVRMLGRLVIGSARGASWTGTVFGPDSPVPNRRDMADVLKMLRWFFGLGPRPKFERWTYWEKFDFWGACADIVIIGATGLILWFPNLFCAVLPGKVLNIAKVIHSTQALLATGFVFAIHFFATHLRPEKFPMDMSILTGLVSEEELEEERPEYLERMRRSGKLGRLRAAGPSRDLFAMIVLGGTVALFVGLALLAGIVWGVVGG